MSSKGSTILELFQQGKRQCEIVYLLNVPRQTVSDTICRFREFGNDGRLPGSGRKRTVNILRDRNVKRVQRNQRVSMRQIAHDIGISDILIKQIAWTKALQVAKSSASL
ncbi:paired domain-containing protein [Trichonephila clavipes]|nr:paired domain-containing protein [Trichonephila clavipes]